MKTFSLIFLAALAVSPMLATTADFSFTGADGSPTCSTCGTGTVSAQGGTQVFSSAGSTDTATVTAWIASYSGGDLGTADVGYYSGAGVGVCEGGASCNTPVHQIDNSTEYEIMEIQFTTPVSISSITLGNYGTDETKTNMSSTIWASDSSTVSTSTALTVASTSLTGFGAGDSSTCTNITGTPNCDTNGQSLSGTVDTISVSGSSFSDVTTLLIAAKIGDSGQNSDFFKVQAINSSSATTGGGTATPEPATFCMAGLALVGLGLYGRRRKANS
jgi:MYXO-CTERM domain-containing protein